ncbi:hypothetical protein [Crossiella cryophila]|uniref:Uncharacterized protein n=1 Tax=Crossiella cryophila TaxID=43355 RepID=A0A7W7FTK8_9PSEU|nr:hypothetical protein [Crossiella cryophila]MBB4674919.1 hypothetical protein [Crossiella cryophila]
MYLDWEKFRYTHSCWTQPVLEPFTNKHTGTSKRRVCEVDPETHARGEVVLCGWERDEVVDLRTPDNCARPHHVESYVPATTFTPVTVWRTEGAGERRANYLEVVATKLNRTELPKALELQDNLRLLRAYTEIGFPRAVRSDDSLRSMLFGPAGLPMDPGHLAAAWQAGQAVLDGEHCDAAGTGLATLDPLAICVAQTAKRRAGLLAQRIEVQSAALRAKPGTETLPMVEEALRNLDLNSTYARNFRPGAG